jgi:hypothetical protein
MRTPVTYTRQIIERLCYLQVSGFERCRPEDCEPPNKALKEERDPYCNSDTNNNDNTTYYH